MGQVLEKEWLNLHMRERILDTVKKDSYMAQVEKLAM